ncbi:diaminopimelate decarboxylase [Neorhizobium sp. 2083]|uniref:diaminopimelate decarboxylase n=1 Tax=Neorhizobium sp. 2083 TaxID=2817762 RepID=UPI00285980E9|nr:diaminopimelate decarboxylase [Neorhizobium sp. 2083]MDR6819951.1 diaminopimelate decarboxylase [Neorhizobium sp. 2083]
MPISQDFAERLYSVLPQIAETFGTPFHIYDEAGIVSGGRRLNELFAGVADFREYFAVKALPNLRILNLLQHELGFGFDCSSIPELQMVRLLGASGSDIFFSSNNTSQEEYAEAEKHGGAILNLDDLSFVDKVPIMPELVCFRYNPGTAGVGNAVIGSPQEAKFGLRTDQIKAAYKRARERGAKRFGLHTMLVTNETRWQNIRDTIAMLLELCHRLNSEMGIQFEFVNMGGGIGIPYRPGEQDVDLVALARAASDLFAQFRAAQGYAPKLFMECGRLITGPHGVLVTRVINIMSKYRDFVGVDASMPALMRTGMYPHAYNHITALTADGRQKDAMPSVVDVVGSLCENNDKFAKRIELPDVREGEFLIIHDTGAHGHAMGFQYNGRLRPKELLLRQTGHAELIRRAETTEDYLQTQIDLSAPRLRLENSQRTTSH